jgi:hypothetical protein
MLSYVVEARELRRALDSLAPVIDVRAGLRMLSRVRVVARGGSLALTVAGPSIHVQATAVCRVAEVHGADGEDPLDAMLPFKDLRAVARVADRDEALRLRLEGDGRVSLGQAGGGSLVFMDGYLDPEFPPRLPLGQGLALRARATAGRLATALARVMPACPHGLNPAERRVILLPRSGRLALAGSDAWWVLRDWLDLADGPDPGQDPLFLDLDDAGSLYGALRALPPGDPAELRLMLCGEEQVLLAATGTLAFRAPLETMADHPPDGGGTYALAPVGKFLDDYDRRDLVADDKILWFSLPAAGVREALATIRPVISKDYDGVLLDLDAHGRLVLGRRERDPGQARHDLGDIGCRPGRPVKGCLPFEWLEHMARMAERHPRLYCALDDGRMLWMSPDGDWPEDVAHRFHAIMFLGHEVYG